MSDRTDFAVTASSFAGSFAVVVTKPGVPEGAGGSTSYAVETDLQPTTRFYWRARMTQGTTTSEWSASRSFKSKLMGFNRPGELYDPLIHGETIGTPVGSTTFVTGKGIRVNDMNSYVRYQLPATISNGEFSAEVEGLYVNGPGAKMKVLSMMNGQGNLFTSKYLLNVQYRGRDGNPDNAIAFKALFGDEDYKLEPDLGQRIASVKALDPNRTYFWKASWNREFGWSFRTAESAARRFTTTASRLRAAPMTPIPITRISAPTTVPSVRKLVDGRGRSIAMCGSATSRAPRRSAARCGPGNMRCVRKVERANAFATGPTAEIPIQARAHGRPSMAGRRAR